MLSMFLPTWLVVGGSAVIGFVAGAVFVLLLLFGAFVVIASLAGDRECSKVV